MEKTREQLIGEIRYAIRLAERTARLYRHIQTMGTFFTVLGGSGTISLLSNKVPVCLGLAGALMLAVAGAALIAIRPADKAAHNEADIRRYQSVMVKAKNSAVTDEQLILAIEEARQGDAPQIESLRDVAFNDVVLEFNRADALISLSLGQKLLAFFA